MNKLEIYLKSGAVIQVDATDVETERNRITGDLTAIRWTSPERWKAQAPQRQPPGRRRRGRHPMNAIRFLAACCIALWADMLGALSRVVAP